MPGPPSKTTHTTGIVTPLSGSKTVERSILNRFKILSATLHQLIFTCASKIPFGDVFLQTATQFNLHSVVPLGPIIHHQEVGVVVIKARESALALDVQLVIGWKTTLQTGTRERCGKKTRAMQVMNLVKNMLRRVPLDSLKHPCCELFPTLQLQ